MTIVARSYIFCWCRPSCCCRGNWWCWAFWLQTMQGWHCQNFVSTKESNINTHFIKGLLVYFLYPATGHKFWLLAKNENASNIKRLFPEFLGDGGVERSNVLGLRGFHSNRTSLWSGHLLPMQGFFQVTFVFRSGSYWLQHILILKCLPPSPSVQNCFLNSLPERAWWPRTWKYTRNLGSFPKRCQESLWDKCLS